MTLCQAVLSSADIQARAQLKHEVEAFELEKAMMARVAVADDDVLNLNVGGKLFTTKRSTLTQVCPLS